MTLNNYLVWILKCLSSVNNKQIRKQLIVNTASVKLLLNKTNYLEINENSIVLNGQYHLEEKIYDPNISRLEIITIKKIDAFFQKISGNITGFNHLGISYSCPDIRKEISYYRSILSNTSLRLYEEDSAIPEDRWLFLGDIKNKDNPLFEIVLTQSKKPVRNVWIPHFQIDLNTSLQYKSLVKTTNALLSEDFFKWSLDFPNYGTVLGMGFLGNITDAKVVLGLGTDLRKKQSLIRLRGNSQS